MLHLLLPLLPLTLFLSTITAIVLPKYYYSGPLDACGIAAGTTSTMLLTLEFLGLAVLVAFGCLGGFGMTHHESRLAAWLSGT